MSAAATEKFIVVEDGFKIWTRCLGGLPLGPAAGSPR